MTDTLNARALANELSQAKLLLEISRACATSSRIDEVLERLVGIIVRELGCERGTVFLHDGARNELFSRYAMGAGPKEIRILSTAGLAGLAFQEGETVVSNTPYEDPRFNASVDEATGFVTRRVLCTPIHTMAGRKIGVVQCLNKADGPFVDADAELLAAMTLTASVSLENLLRAEEAERMRVQELDFLNLVSEISAEVELAKLLARVVEETTRMLDAERATIFLNDEATGTLFSVVLGGSAGNEVNEIRLPNHAGIAGAVFTSGTSLNIPYAYADIRFNPGFDRTSGFFTRSILCAPIRNKENRVIGVTQVLNKRGGPFTEDEERRLIAFTAQISIALENSKLFDDVRRIKVYNENMLQSMSNGVITLDALGRIVTCNAAGRRMWPLPGPTSPGTTLSEILGADSTWLTERIEAVRTSGVSETYEDCDLTLCDERKSLNLTISPLLAEDGSNSAGSMLVAEDISDGKRMLSTMSRYIDPQIAAKMLEGGGLNALGGVTAEATVMFTDIRGFTTITEEAGPEGTVAFLNEYFSLMVDCISREDGMLDKFIGDAIMACFGLPIAQPDAPDRAVRAAISMVRTLWNWNDTRRQAGLKTVDMGIGLNTDALVSGNIGSPKRMDYTVIGDGVNLASRLESACKAYNARILISENTAARLRGTYRLRDIDLVVVKGKTAPVRVFEVLDYHTPETFPNLMDVVNYFNEGMEAYRGARWDQAIQRFITCLDRNPHDKLSGLYVDRCRSLQANPPGDAWDGVWVMREK